MRGKVAKMIKRRAREVRQIGVPAAVAIQAMREDWQNSSHQRKGQIREAIEAPAKRQRIRKAVIEAQTKLVQQYLGPTIERLASSIT